jgi:hypothetical protein
MILVVGHIPMLPETQLLSIKCYNHLKDYRRAFVPNGIKAICAGKIADQPVE